MDSPSTETGHYLSPLRCPSAALLYFPLCLLSRCRGCGAVVVSHQGCWCTSYYHSPVRSYMKGFRSHLGPGHGTFDSKKKLFSLMRKSESWLSTSSQSKSQVLASESGEILVKVVHAVALNPGFLMVLNCRFRPRCPHW